MRDFGPMQGAGEECGIRGESRYLLYTEQIPKHKGIGDYALLAEALCWLRALRLFPGVLVFFPRH